MQLTHKALIFIYFFYIILYIYTIHTYYKYYKPYSFLLLHIQKSLFISIYIKKLTEKAIHISKDNAPTHSYITKIIAKIIMAKLVQVGMVHAMLHKFIPCFITFYLGILLDETSAFIYINKCLNILSTQYIQPYIMKFRYLRLKIR